MDDYQNLVYEIGSGFSIVGFCGDDGPRAVFPTICGRLKNPGIMVGMDAKDCFVGDEATAKTKILNLKRPVQFGMPRLWDDYEKILHHSVYNELCCCPEEHPIFVIEPPFVPQIKRKKITEIFFEVPAFYLEAEGVCSLYASGKDSGCAAVTGYDCTRTCCIYGGNVLSHSIFVEDYGLKNIDNIFQKQIKKLEVRIKDTVHSMDFFDYENFKNEYLYVPSYSDSYNKTKIIKTKYKKSMYRYQLPDLNVIFPLEITQRTKFSPELFFEPEKYDIMGASLPNLIHFSIISCSTDLTELLYKNIVVTGQATHYKNFFERFNNDFHVNDFPKNQKGKKICSLSKPSKHLTWIGGSIISYRVSKINGLQKLSTMMNMVQEL